MALTSKSAYSKMNTYKQSAGNAKAATKAAENELQSFTKNRVNPLDYYNQSEQALGVGDVRGRVGNLRREVSNTEALLGGVGDSVAGRTSGSNVTEAQRSRLIALERRPYEESFQTQQRALGDEQSTLQDLLGQAGQRSGLMYQGDADKQSALQSTYDRAAQRRGEAVQRYESQRQFALNLKQMEQQEAQQRRALAAQKQAAAQQLAAARASFNTPGAGDGGYGMAQKNKSKGFKFVDSRGNPVSAATYAAATGQDFRQLLSKMAKKGDTGAKAALGFVGSDARADSGKWGGLGQNNRDLYSALTWGAF